MNIKESFLTAFIKNNRLILLISFINFLIIYLPNFLGHYGYFYDELYMIVHSKRPAWGYVDNPPFATFLLGVIRLLLGDSIFAIRLFPALASAVLTFLIGIITRKLGGKKFAEGMACLAFSIMPLFLVLNSSYTALAFESLILTSCVLILITIIQGGKGPYWLLAGLIAGIGLLNKHTFAVFIFAFLAGMMLTPLKNFFKNRFFWFGVLTTAIIIFPNIIWEIQNNFISIKYYNSVREHALAPTPLIMIAMIPVTAFIMNPLVFLICVAGIIFLFSNTESKPYRVFGWMVLISFFFYFLTNIARVDRIAPLYPILIASGSVIMENWMQYIGGFRPKPLIIALLIIGGMFSALISLPVLQPETLYKHVKMIESKIDESKDYGILLNRIISSYCTNFFYRLGWEPMTEDVVAAYNKLSPQDKARAVIVTGHYGEAGAIEFFGAKYNLPKVIALNENYRIWENGTVQGNPVIATGFNREALNTFFEEVELLGTIRKCDFCLYYKNDSPIYACRKMKTTQ